MFQIKYSSGTCGCGIWGLKVLFEVSPDENMAVLRWEEPWMKRLNFNDGVKLYRRYSCFKR